MGMGMQGCTFGMCGNKVWDQGMHVWGWECKDVRLGCVEMKSGTRGCMYGDGNARTYVWDVWKRSLGPGDARMGMGMQGRTFGMCGNEVWDQGIHVWGCGNWKQGHGDP